MSRHSSRGGGGNHGGRGGFHGGGHGGNFHGYNRGRDRYHGNYHRWNYQNNYGGFWNGVYNPVDWYNPYYVGNNCYAFRNGLLYQVPCGWSLSGPYYDSGAVYVGAENTKEQVKDDYKEFVESGKELLETVIDAVKDLDNMVVECNKAGCDIKLKWK